MENIPKTAVWAKYTVDLILHGKTYNNELLVCVSNNLQQREYTKNVHNISVVWV